jgi:hypothetical protein
MHLIGICGKKGSGKDSAAKGLIRSGYRPFAFARPLKVMLTALFDYLDINPSTIDRMLNEDLKEMPVPDLEGHTTRYALQTLGTEWGRMCLDKDIWINIAIAKAKQYHKTVITDVRFANEASAIKAAGGLVIRIVRDSADSARDEHASEAVDSVIPDFYADNNGSIEDLQERILNIANEYERRN